MTSTAIILDSSQDTWRMSGTIYNFVDFYEAICFCDLLDDFLHPKAFINATEVSAMKIVNQINFDGILSKFFSFVEFLSFYHGNFQLIEKSEVMHAQKDTQRYQIE